MALITADTADPLVKNFINYRSSFRDFAMDCLFTIDQARKAIRPYPNLNDPVYKYLDYVTQQMLSETLLAIVKHRRMIITWGGIVSISTWDTLFHEATDVAIFSKKN